MIQDRLFNPDGTFLYPTSDIDGATWIGEYFGDTMLVNGKVWPFLDVEPRMYRFRILNGCNARILSLDIGAPSLWQIGAEGGMWDVPVPVKRLVLAPAERADVLVDFSRFAGQTLVLKNHNPSKPVVTPAPSLAQVMQIRVGTTVEPAGTDLDPVEPARAHGRPARSGHDALHHPERDRHRRADLVLEPERCAFRRGTDDRDPEGRHGGGLGLRQPHRRHPPDAHAPGHVPGGRPDAVRRRGLRGGVRGPARRPRRASTRLRSRPVRCCRPTPEERGFKDTVKANPGYFTTIRARFELPTGVTAPQDYVYHCHIVEHEDNDMMRPFTVRP